MRKIRFFITFCLAAILGGMTMMAHADNSIQWQSYSGLIFDQAKKEHKLVLLYGKSDWCHWCQKMDSSTWNDSAVIDVVNASFIPVKVDVTDDAEIAKSYNIKGTPTLVIVSGNRQVVKTLYGFSEPYELVGNLKAIAGRR